MQIHPGLFSTLGLALAALGLGLGSATLCFVGLGLAASALAVMLGRQRDPTRTRWLDWATQRGLVEDEEGGHLALKGARRGQPVLVHFEESRVHAACRLELPVERSFPPSAPRILSHIREADEQGATPTPTLRDPETREAWRRVLESGHNARVVNDEVRITLNRQGLEIHQVDEALDEVADLAERMLLLRAA